MSSDPTTMAPSVFDEFQWRGLVYDATPDAAETLAKEPVTGYIGFDPTADSLHVGSLLPIMCLARMQRFGHTPLAIVGGGTGMIGDPSGKSKERSMLTPEQIEHNVAGIRAQLARFLDFDAKDNPAQIINNAEWLGAISLIDFLRDVGKHFTINYMLGKESVKRRIESEEGISYTEFTYMMLQAYDFHVLHRRYGCTLQMGGSDQWGNITAGTDLVRRLGGAPVHGVTFPLVTNAAGTKFGKTEAGTVWLDPARTSPYRFYQFWLNTDDRDVVPYLKYFTWMTRDEIEALEAAVAERPERREAQQALAEAVTRMVHGEQALAAAQQASAVLFGGSLDNIAAADIRDIFEDVPSTELDRAAFEDEGLWIVALLADAGVTQSRGEARRLVKSGGVYLNNERVTDEQHKVTADAAIDGELLVLRKGQKNFHLVSLR